jgi:hypothetical protein
MIFFCVAACGLTKSWAARSAYAVQNEMMLLVPSHPTHNESAVNGGAARGRRPTGRELLVNASRPALRAAQLSFEPTRSIVVPNIDRRARAAQLTAR